MLIKELVQLTVINPFPYSSHHPLILSSFLYPTHPFTLTFLPFIDHFTPLIPSSFYPSIHLSIHPLNPTYPIMLSSFHGSSSILHQRHSSLIRLAQYDALEIEPPHWVSNIVDHRSNPDGQLIQQPPPFSCICNPMHLPIIRHFHNQLFRHCLCEWNQN